MKENSKNERETMDVKIKISMMEDKIKALKEKLSRDKAEKIDAQQKFKKFEEINRKLKTEVKKAAEEVVTMKRRYRRVKEELETAVEWSRHLEGEVVDLRTELELGTMKKEKKTTDEKKRSNEKEDTRRMFKKVGDEENNESEAETIVKSNSKVELEKTENGLKEDEQKVAGDAVTNEQHDEKRHPCCVDDCNLRFSRLGYLNDHMRAEHGSPKLQCSEPGCSKKYVKSRNLRDHKMYVHKGIGPHKCKVDGCGKKYVRKRDLKDHKRASHGRAKLRCPEPGCHEEFAWTASFYRHRKEHML